jgi:hypothetical protein
MNSLVTSLIAGSRRRSSAVVYRVVLSVTPALSEWSRSKRASRNDLKYTQPSMIDFRARDECVEGSRVLPKNPAIISPRWTRQQRDVLRINVMDETQMQT